MKYLKFSFLKNKIEIFISALLFVVLFNNIYSNIILIFTVVLIFTDKKNYKFKISYKSLLIIIFYLYILIVELFSIDKQGFDYLVRQLPILLITMSLGFYNFKKKQIEYLLNSIIIINYFFFALAIIFGLYEFIYDFLYREVIEFRYYQWVVPVKLNIHPPYWGFFIVVSTIIILRNSFLKNFKKFFFCFFAFVFLLLLSSRSALLSMLFIIVIELFYNKLIPKKIKYFIISFFIFILTLVATSRSYLVTKILNNEGLQSRIDLWEISTVIIKENFLFGSSFHNSNEKIESLFTLSNKVSINNYDLHNQFLCIFVSYGFCGLSLFLLILFYRKKYDSNYIMFIFSVLIIFSTESILNRQMGVIIFSLFLSFINIFTFKKN